MKQKHISSLSELETEINDIKQMISSTRRHPYQILSKPLFRGHADESWKLETTLERFSSSQYSVQSYNHVMYATACATASLTGRSWSVEMNPKLNDVHISVPPNYEFMAHARHHGFPTPLLDWTQSLYVALFFAFNEAQQDKNVAIYVYIETLNGGKGGFVGAPTISLLGPHVSTHKRHFLQQGQYTVATELIGDTWYYCDHLRALTESGGEHQDVVYKFTLPGSLRNNMLRKLQEMNINAFTLLGDENSLMSMLAFKELTMRDEDFPPVPKLNSNGP